ncbi:hypothetical protein E4P39_12395 [Blastococcus sp. CT_GayMR19]|uniref:hypothetical protein n=1 Tax=Blastococcus sp. CT_GayMR19 TaxID=2559608 RepID=UPI0010746E80|nr:hypothetical protein [Blastococcus sp. CT_GayMR19]TFV74293.1 hypothetical protein E4P39_12395 [Blastococcus sp. CT_GayMR19]
MTTTGTRTAPLSRRVRRIAAGGSLILFSAVLIPQALLDPAEGGTGEVMYRAATEHSAALTVSAVLLIVSAVLMAPAAAGVLHQARDRGAGLADVGAALAVLGGFGYFGIALFYVVSLSLAGGDEAEMIAFIDRLNESAVLGAVAFPLILCFGLGVALLPWAAWRAGAVGVWAPALATVAVLVGQGLPFSNDVTVLATVSALVVVFVHLGVRVLRMTDAEWDGVPRVASSAEPTRV